MQKILLPATLFLFLTALSACGGALTRENAHDILSTAYTGHYNPDEAGGSHTVLDNLTIDSIQQKGSHATVFYRISGRVENGSRYPQTLDSKEQEADFQRGLFGNWKDK